MNYVNYFTTKDQVLSSILYSSGQKLDSYFWRGNTCYFVFEDEKKCEEIISKYYNGNLKMDIKAYNDAAQTIKNIIFSRN